MEENECFLVIVWVSNAFILTNSKQIVFSSYHKRDLRMKKASFINEASRYSVMSLIAEKLISEGLLGMKLVLQAISEIPFLAQSPTNLLIAERSRSFLQFVSFEDCLI